MGLFTSKQPSLHELHAEAHELGTRALSVFHALAGDLQGAAAQHDEVASRAQDEIDKLVELRDAAMAAAYEKARAATAITNLIK